MIPSIYASRGKRQILWTRTPALGNPPQHLRTKMRYGCQGRHGNTPRCFVPYLYRKSFCKSLLFAKAHDSCIGNQCPPTRHTAQSCEPNRLDERKIYNKTHANGEWVKTSNVNPSTGKETHISAEPNRGKCLRYNEATNLLSEPEGRTDTDYRNDWRTKTKYQTITMRIGPNL